MLSLEKPMVVAGVTVFRDHADPNSFWYLPGPVSLGKRPDGTPAFGMLKYKPAVAGAGVHGGGFLMLETTLGLSPEVEGRIRSRCEAEPGVTPPVRLAAPSWESGTVKCIALDLQGAGGTVADPDAPAGAFRAVEAINGATSPSLDAENRAAFSLTLSQEGATILADAFANRMAPVGVIYDLAYLAMRPALDVEITADYKRVFQHFGANLAVQYMFLRADLEAAFESLKSSGAIRIKVINFTDDQNARDQEKWALDMFREDLLSKWFEPTLTPGQLAAGRDTATPIGDVIAAGRELSHPATPTPTPTPTPAGGTPAPAGPAGPGAAAAIPPAALVVDLTEPAPLPPGRSVTHVPTTSGTGEQVTIVGAGAVVTVEGRPVAADAQGRIAIVVEAGAEKAITIDWPGDAATQTFALFFDFDKPDEAGWRVSPPSDGYRSYVENGTADPRYQDASGILQPQDGAWTGPERGADRLSAWVRALPAGKAVTLDAYASHEHVNESNETLRAQYNLRLSQRRLDVAAAVVQRAGGTITARNARGDMPAEGRPGSHGPMGGDPDNRAVYVAGQGGRGAPIRWRGRLRRAAAAPAPGPAPGPAPAPNPAPGPAPAPASPAGSSPIVASLKLRYLQQREDKTLTFRYSRSEAVRRSYAPQGFVGLMLDALADKNALFREIDLDDPFFRQIGIEARVPVAFDAIGLSGVVAAIDYGDPADPPNHKHAEFRFVAGDAGPKTTAFFLNADRATDYRIRYSFDFDPQAAWDADRYSYEIAAADSEKRTLFVNPYDHIDFRDIVVEAGDVDWQVVRSIDVELVATGYGAAPLRRLLTLVANGAAQHWRLRGARPAPADRAVRYVLTQHLVDGSSMSAPAELLPLDRLVANDLFSDALQLEFFPAFPPTPGMQVRIDVDYEDVASGYRREERLEMAGDATASMKLRLALRDPARRIYRYRFHFFGPGPLEDRRAWIETGEELISVR